LANVIFRDLCKVYDKDVAAVKDFNLEIADKEFIVLVGPSGCGKSTTLRMVAGLETISSGKLFIGDRLVNEVAPKDRDIAMVFQNYALYPHLNVYENMAFALKLRKTPKAEIDRKVGEAAEILGITELLKRRPKALSGGQRQRVAIGRSIVREPKVFLMDEPLSNLDAKLRNQMRTELIKIHQRVDTTFIYVTHDQTEAMTLGDRMVVMKDGLIQQTGTPEEVFNHPGNLFVAGFIGSPQMNFFDARLQKTGGRYHVRVEGMAVDLPDTVQQALRRSAAGDMDITAGVRPEHISLVAGGTEGSIKASADVSEMMGSSTHLHVSVRGKDVVIIQPVVSLQEEYRSGFPHGREIRFTFGGNVVHLFSRETGANLVENPYKAD
jgi:multiple sugar transport system ATP-binding protein